MSRLRPTLKDMFYFFCMIVVIAMLLVTTNRAGWVTGAPHYALLTFQALTSQPESTSRPRRPERPLARLKQLKESGRPPKPKPKKKEITPS
jgi:hypothetical protein